MARSSFAFVDLFAGIGGFHAVGAALGGDCVYAVESDPVAARVYARNWGMDPLGDVVEHANDDVVLVPEHDVLFAGFPCQPFSKSGKQRGMDDARGTLYWHILRVLETRRPALVLLENVRNLTGPRHRHEWETIVETLRDVGYRVSEEASLFSPHLLPKEDGGRPQRRDRVFITATYVGRRESLRGIDPGPVCRLQPQDSWDPTTWNLETDLPLEEDQHAAGAELSESEVLWIDAWAEFVRLMSRERGGRRLPGFPLWADHWVDERSLRIPRDAPDWKRDFLRKNAAFYSAHRRVLDGWLAKWGVRTEAFTPARRKFEWQAQDARDLWDTVMHLRPSGLRAKAPTYVPALVAMNQTSIVGSRERRISPREAARLQGLPDWFDFGDQSHAATYRQLGNGVSIGAVWHVLKRHAERDEEQLKKVAPRLLRAIQKAPASPDEILNSWS